MVRLERLVMVLLLVPMVQRVLRLVPMVRLERLVMVLQLVPMARSVLRERVQQMILAPM